MPTIVSGAATRPGRAGGEAMRAQIRHAIAVLTARHNRPPTNREIGAFLGGKSTGHISYHLERMSECGNLLHTPRCARGISLPQGEDGAPAGAAFEALRAEHARVMAENARLRAHLAGLQARLERAS